MIILALHIEKQLEHYSAQMASDAIKASESQELEGRLAFITFPNMHLPIPTSEITFGK